MNSVRARVTLAATSAAGRERPINLQSGYRPHLRIHGGALLGVELTLEHEHWLSPGESADVEVGLLYDIDYSSLVPGVTFTILEGGTREVGHGIVL